MTQKVEAGGETFEFPDGMKSWEIKAALDKHFGRPPIPSPKDVMRNIPMGGQRRPMEMMPRTKEALSDLAVGVSQGATFGLSDEISAGVGAAMGRGSYDENMERYGARLGLVDPAARTLGMLGGGSALGAAMPFSFLSGAAPKLGSLVPRSMAEGAMYGSMYGAGTASPGERTEGAVEGGLLGAATGVPVGVASRLLVTGQRGASLDDLSEASKKLLNKVESAPIKVKGAAVKSLTNRMSSVAKKLGTDKALHPRVAAVLNHFDDAVQGQSSFPMADMMVLRRVLRNASSSADDSERMVAQAMTDEFDDFIGKLPMGVAGKWKEGRLLWGRYRKAMTVEQLIENAGIRAGQFTGSGYENALRTEFRSLARNQKRMRWFTKEEQEAIKKIAKGGLIGNLYRALGRFSIRGPVSGAATGMLGYTAGGPAGVAAGAAIGEGGRMMATRSTLSNVDDLIYRLTTGDAPLLLSDVQKAALRAIIAGEQAALSPTPEVMN